jgi:hypothetical protein
MDNAMDNAMNYVAFTRESLERLTVAAGPGAD